MVPRHGRGGYAVTFTYTDDNTLYQQVLGQPIGSFRSKHVLSCASGRAQALFSASLPLSPMCKWGAGLFPTDEENLAAQVHTIRQMVRQKHMQPVRIVIDRFGNPWADNLHGAIRDLFVFGDGATFLDVPCYLVDLTKDVPLVVNCRQGLSANMAHIQGAVEAAWKRDSRVDEAVGAARYTIWDLLLDNGITKESLYLPASAYQAYAKAVAEKLKKGGRAYGA